jgi:hypothetical protein
MTDEHLFIRMFCSSRYRWTRHLVAIVLLLAIINVNAFQPGWRPFVRIGVLFFLAGIPYVNMYVLIPRLLENRRYYAYGAGLLLLVFTALLLEWSAQPLLSQMLLPGETFMPYTVSDVLTFFVLMIILLAAATAVKLFQRWALSVFREAALRNTIQRIELERLRKQLSPHFLFNTLNNLDCLIYADQEKASALVHKLSGLLRYHLYLSEEALVPLGKEICFIQDFLALEQMRHDTLEVTITHQGEWQRSWIRSHLLIPFVENAVKHNDYTTSPFINIDFSATGSQLTFCCVNRRGPGGPLQEGGLGLKNIRRRLELLYPQKHNVVILANEDVYEVKLTLSI